MNRLRIISNILISITLVLFPITYSKSEEENPSTVVFSGDYKSSVSLSDEDMCGGESCGHQWVTTDPETGRKVYHIDFSHPEASQKSKYGTPPKEGTGRNTRVGSYRGGSGQGFSGPIISEVLAMEAYVKAYEDYAQISTSIITTDIINFLKSHLDQLLQNELFSNSSAINEQWIAKANDIATEIEPVVTQLAYSTGVPGLHSSDWANIIRIITNAIKKEMYKEITYFRWNSMARDTIEELKNIFLNSKNPIKLTDSIIATTESQIQDVIDNPFDIPVSYEFSEEEKLRATVQIEEYLYDTAKQMIDEYLFAPSQNNFNQQINSLAETAEKSNIAIKNTYMEPVFHEFNPYKRYQKNITEVAQQKIKSKYTRAELGLLKKEELIPPEEDLYRFLSPDGLFFDKLRDVYDKLRNANPYHEQGILAREVGLSAVEVADEEYIQGNEAEAELALQVAEAMSDIAIGVLFPSVGTGKDFYELITGRHLLTGRQLSLFERAMAGVGIILSARSSGVLNSGHLKLAGTVISKINRKLLARNLRGLSESQLLRVVEKYPEKFLQSLDSIGLNTKTGIQSALKFVKRAFARENPSVGKFEQVVQKVGREGIESYTRALDQLDVKLKTKNLKLPKSGEEFLARQLRLGHKLNSDQLVEVGEISAYAESRIGTTIKPISFPKSDQSGQIWRVVRKSGTSETTGKNFDNTQETVFDIHPDMIKENHRYSPQGKVAIFTSLDKETALKEFAKGLDAKGLDVRNTPYIVGSRTLDNFDGVLDLTDTKVQKQLKISLDSKGINNIKKNFEGNPNAYIVPNLLRETAERKGIKAILAPVSKAISDEGGNFIILKDGLL